MKGDNTLDKDLEGQEEITMYQTMFPGYENHVYKNAFSNELIAPEKLPASPCHSYK